MAFRIFPLFGFVYFGIGLIRHRPHVIPHVILFHFLSLHSGPSCRIDILVHTDLIEWRTDWIRRFPRLHSLHSPFKPVPDEELSTNRVNLLLALGIAVPLAGALLQALFAYLYFRFGHPWARVLNSQVLTVKHDSNPTLCSRFTEYLNIVEGIIGK